MKPIGRQCLVPDCIQSNPVNFYPLDFKKVGAITSCDRHISGLCLMHELIFHHVRSQKASVGGHVILSCMANEIGIKREIKCTLDWLSTAFGGVCGGSSMPTAGRCKADDVEARMEIISFINFAKLN
uniref:Uncharacterized protein n=1 Tax=Salix viminalis TaxID=40686 RepID=A0A6N2M1M9_SALVM